MRSKIKKLITLAIVLGLLIGFTGVASSQTKRELLVAKTIETFINSVDHIPCEAFPYNGEILVNLEFPKATNDVMMRSYCSGIAGLIDQMKSKHPDMFGKGPSIILHFKCKKTGQGAFSLPYEVKFKVL